LVELTVLCEGQTEARFVERTLKPFLASRGVYVRPPIALNRKRFGVVSRDALYRAIKLEVGRLRGHQYLTSMIDLYALPDDFAGRTDASQSSSERAAGIENSLTQVMPSRNWIPYIQLHEFESLIYVDLDHIQRQYPQMDLTIGLRDLRSDVGRLSPEEIDDGHATAPSKRLLRHIPIYAKAIAGPAIVDSIGIQRLKEACPHFRQWVEKLEALGA
jgi:uncharacterized protein DUF4276